MTGDDIVRSKLASFFRLDNNVMAGKVVSVDKAKVLCRVSLIENEDIVLEDVRLRAIDDELDKGFILFPKVDSTVLIGQIKNTSAYYVAMYSDIDKISLQNDNQSLKTILEDLIAQIKLITVPTAVGVSGTPINFAQFDLITTRIADLLEN